MAIRTMTSKENAGLPNVETVTNYTGHEAGLLRHARTCPHFVEGAYDERGRELEGLYPDCVLTDPPGSYGHCWVGEPLYMETHHVGVVLELGEYNGRDDSDFYAVCWNAEKGMPERVEYASTRGWTYPNGATVDATPEVVAAYLAYCDKVEAARAAAEAARLAATPAFGKTVKVVRGRKVPVGTVGEVTWYGMGKSFSPRANFRPTSGAYSAAAPMRVGFRTLDGTVHFTDAKNVEVVLPCRAHEDCAEVAELGIECAKAS